MQTINLKKYYYPLCRQDTYLTVSDEVAEALLLMRREENNHARKVWYHKAYFSLDCDKEHEIRAYRAVLAKAWSLRAGIGAQVEPVGGVGVVDVHARKDAEGHEGTERRQQDGRKPFHSHEKPSPFR